MRSLLRIALLLATLVVWAPGVSAAQESLTKRDGQGPVTVVVTLLTPPATGSPVKAKIVLDTHSVGLDSIAFDKVVAIQTADGADIGPTAVEAKGSGHHREAVLDFPPLASAGPLRIVVKNVGGVAERSFVWEVQPAR